MKCVLLVLRVLLGFFCLFVSFVFNMILAESLVKIHVGNANKNILRKT